MLSKFIRKMIMCSKHMIIQAIKFNWSSSCHVTKNVFVQPFWLVYLPEVVCRGRSWRSSLNVILNLISLHVCFKNHSTSAYQSCLIFYLLYCFDMVISIVRTTTSKWRFIKCKLRFWRSCSLWSKVLSTLSLCLSKW